MTAITAAGTDATARVGGTVRWFSHKGFGFIDGHDGADIYVHHSGITGNGFRTLAADAEVRFTIRQTPRGPEAVEVTVVEG